MAIVRIYTHSGFAAHPLPDNAHLLVYPYLGTEELDCRIGFVAESKPETAPPATKVARIEVHGDGERVHFEITPANHELRAAGKHSPTIKHGALIAFGAGYVISVWSPAP